MLALVFQFLLADPIPVVESKDFSADCQRAAVTATVRFTNGSGKSVGSGVIISRDRLFVYVLTANHVLEKVDAIGLETFTEDSYPKPEKAYKGGAKVVAQSKEQDLTLVRLTTSDKPPGILRVCPLKLTPTVKDFPALTIGCDAGESPTCQVEKVRSKKLVKRPGDKVAVWTWEIAEAPKRGRSGGPLLDAKGNLLGICSGSGDGSGYYCHIDEIHRFLKLNGFEHLYTEEEKK